MKHYSKKGIIFLCSLVYFTSYFARKSFAVTSVEIIKSGFLDKSTAGLIGTALFAMYGVGQIISGLLSDRLSPKALILVGLSTTAVCNLLMSLITVPYLMIPVWGINGLAQAMLWPPIVRIFSHNLNSEEYVKANFMAISAAHISTMLLYFYVPLCLSFSDWRAVFVSASILSVAVGVLFAVGLAIVLPSSPVTVQSTDAPTPKAVSNAPENVKFTKLLLKAGILPIFVAIITMGFLRDGIESWLPTLYAEAFNQDAQSSILVSVILPVFAILSTIITTALHKTIFKNETYGAGILFAISVALSIPFFFFIEKDAAIFKVLCLVLAALICGCMHGVNFMYICCLPGRFARYGRSASASGICNAFTYIGASISTYGIALIAQSIGWKANIFTWGCVALLGLISALLSMRKYTKFIKQD